AVICIYWDSDADLNGREPDLPIEKLTIKCHHFLHMEFGSEMTDRKCRVSGSVEGRRRRTYWPFAAWKPVQFYMSRAVYHYLSVVSGHGAQDGK
ncbi:hypothetical protein CRM22_000059, partial [Opisthorchis felineus]